MPKLLQQLNQKPSRGPQYDLSDRSFHGFTWWTPFPFVRFTLYLIAGIGLAVYTGAIDPAPFRWALYLLAGLYGLLWILTRQVAGMRITTLFGMLGGVTLSLAGFLIMQTHVPSQETSHLLNQPANTQLYRGTIIAEVQERANHYKAELAVEAVRTGQEWRRAGGKVLVYLAKTGPTPQYGDQLLIKGTPQPVLAPANPGEFDYRGYLAIQQIHHQHFLKAHNYIIYGHSVPNPVLAASLKVRDWAKGVFRRHITTSREYTIAVGLVLGIRTGMDEEMKAAYASAGAMHVLAVSGAHVVIVCWIVTLLLGFLKKFWHGRWLFALTALGLLWFYAFVTGLSSSVLRAVVMFSFVIIADASGREKSNYNFLAASAFLLLCLNPWYLLDVGFQLSYAAVLGIVYLHPKMYGWVDCRTRLADKLWGMTSTCLAAQIAVLPFTLFYFHQFPVYFLLANLVVIPLSSAILYAGILLLFVSWIPWVSAWVSLAFEGMIWLLNQSALLTLRLPGAIIGGFFINKLEFLLLTALLVMLLVFLQAKKLWQLGAVSGLLLALVVIDVWEQKEQVNQQKLALYAVKGYSAIGIIEGQNHLLVADSALLTQRDKIKFHLQNDWQAAGVTQSTFLPLGSVSHPMLLWHHADFYSVFIWNGKRFVVLNQPSANPVPAALTADVLVVRQNALRHLRDWTGRCKQLVIDGSNKYWLGNKLTQQANDLRIPCHWMARDGAYCLNRYYAE